MTALDQDDELLDQIDKWISLHGHSPDIVFVSKRLTRLGAVTENIARAIIKWATNDPDNEDVPWRLSALG
ncbi:MAG TPA: hypothetical protein VFE14_09410, partial [Micromonosporaceae bacterium]|nr:hypothetical protein [Micromonosporaceae bacterium]